MKRMYSIKALGVFALSFAFMVSACNDQAEPTKEQEQVQSTESTQSQSQSQSILLSLEGQEAEYSSVDATGARAVAFEVTNAGPKLKMTEEKMQSIAVIANQDKSTTYYVNIEWSKEANKNRLYTKDYEIKQDLDGKPLNLDTNQAWYIMGYVGGTYDKATKRVKYNPNGSALQAGANGEVIKKAVPVYFPWTKLEVKHYGSYQLALSGLDRINFKALGTMLRVPLRNSFGQDIRIKNLRFLSNAMTTTEGYYNISKAMLPATNSVDLPSFSLSTPTSTASNNYYRSLNEPIYTLQSNDGSPMPVDLTNGRTAEQSFLIWAMPVSSKPTNPVTHLLADVARLKNGVEQTLPKMETLYVWGTNRVFAERSRQLLTANVLRTKMALEYFAPDYAGYGAMKDALSIPPYYGTTSRGIPLFSYQEASSATTLKNGWRVPKYKDARGLFMVDLSNTNRGSHAALAFGGSNERRSITQQVRVNGELATYRDIYQVGASIYALRFHNIDNGFKHYSAWRYSYSETNGALIEAVFLGPEFKGTLDDITNNYFWETHKKDKVIRKYAASYYMYYDNIWNSVALSNFWAIHEPISNLTEGERVWGFGHENTWYMGHRQHYYGNTTLTHIAHIIPLEAIGTSWRDN